MHYKYCIYVIQYLTIPGLLDTPGATCQVSVSVSDRNDIPPLFTRKPRNNLIEIRNDAPIGERIGSVTATDSDGTQPGNIVKYHISDSGSTEKSKDYFRIDEDTGDIYIKDDLTKELYDVYTVILFIITSTSSTV